MDADQLPVGLEGGVHEQLLEHVLLGMAGAELVHAADGRTHQGDGFGVASGRVGELGVGDRQRTILASVWMDCTSAASCEATDLDRVKYGFCR